MAHVDVDQIDASVGRKVVATHQLDGLLLFQALSRIHRAGSLPMNMFLRSDGIGIPGYITDPDGRLHMDLGRIVEGSLIGKEPKNIYLQVFEYDDAPNGVPDIDLPKLLKEYLEPSLKAVEVIEAHQGGLVAKVGRALRRMTGSR